MADLYILSWRDIPAEVVATLGSRTVRHVLSRRFLDAIDRVALREGRTRDDAPTPWRQGPMRSCGDDIEAEAQAAADRIEAAYDAKMLAELSAAGGHAGGDDHMGHRAL